MFLVFFFEKKNKKVKMNLFSVLSDNKLQTRKETFPKPQQTFKGKKTCRFSTVTCLLRIKWGERRTFQLSENNQSK